MLVYPRLQLVPKHPVEEQPGYSMVKETKDIELHPKKECSNPSLKVFGYRSVNLKSNFS